MDSTGNGMAPSDVTERRSASVLRTVRELERHVGGAGWDGAVRVFALVRTADAVRRDPALAGQLPAEVLAAAGADDEHLTAVEQEDLPAGSTLEELLGRIAWPGTVDGAAVVLERVVLPPEVEIGIPEDEEAAARYLAEHPARRDVRMAAAVLRDGTSGCAVRARDHDSDDRVAVGADLVPALVQAVATTLD